MEIIDGAKVINRLGNVGTVLSHDTDYILVDFNGETKVYPLNGFVNGFLKYKANELQEPVNKLIEATREEERLKEESRKLKQEENLKRRLEEDERKKREADLKLKEKKNSKKGNKIHPYIIEKRANGKPAVFMVCQNHTYNHEIEEHYLWAGIDAVPSHSELELVNVGDVVFHHFNNKIYAISTVLKKCEYKAAKLGHPNYNTIGRYVEVKTHKLLNAADTTNLKDYKVKYGSMKYGPFTITGLNKRSNYLSELADDIAKVFMQAAIDANPGDTELLEFMKLI